jgi:2'-5' RNA ligase
MEQEKRKYFIGCLLPKAISLRCKRIAGDLVGQFAVNNVFEKYEPHITWKAPFFASEDEISEVKELLQKFKKGRHEIAITMKGFGHFSTGVVFCDIIAHDEKLELIQSELCQALELLSWNIGFEKQEPSGIFHVTIAIDDIRGRFPEVFDYLKRTHREELRFEIDSIDLFKKVNDGKWEVDERFSLIKTFNY